MRRIGGRGVIGNQAHHRKNTAGGVIDDLDITDWQTVWIAVLLGRRMFTKKADSNDPRYDNPSIGAAVSAQGAAADRELQA